MCAMLHKTGGHCGKSPKLFVPHIVARKSWFDCGKSLLHTKLGSNHVFFAAMLHSLFVPHIVVTVPHHAAFPEVKLAHTTGVLAMQPLCRSHGWTVVNHYYTQHWGLTMCFLRQCWFVPHIVVTMLQNWLGLGHAAFVQKS